MRNVPHPPIGVPVKQSVSFDDGYAHDNLYLLRMNFAEAVDGKVVHNPNCYLFTLNELTESAERYYREMDIVIGRQSGAVIGYAYPIIYENRNGVLTTRFFCRFKGDQVEGMDGQAYCGLFSPRELRRAHDRYQLYIESRFSFINRLFYNLKKRLKRGGNDE